MAVCPKCGVAGVIGSECPDDGYFFVEDSSLSVSTPGHLLGQKVGGRFVPVSIVGEGGIGIIYKAIQKPLGREVALKVMKDDFMDDEVLRERFLREAEVIASLKHTNIVTLYDCGFDERINVLYMAMDFLTGDTLYKAMKSGLDLGRTVSIFKGIASGLAEAHRNGIIHRDLKPDNVFLTTDSDGNEVPQILDFGFARLQGASKKLTQVGVAFGTPHYMSPEQAMGLEKITSGADIYATGVMLFEVVSGHFPYDGKGPMEVMTKHVRDAIPECVPRDGFNVPRSLLQLIERCIQKEPEDRYADGEELLGALEVIEEEVQGPGWRLKSAVVDSVGGSSPGSGRKFFERLEARFGRLNVILGSLLILLALFFIFVVLLGAL